VQLTDVKQKAAAQSRLDLYKTRRPN